MSPSSLWNPPGDAVPLPTTEEWLAMLGQAGDQLIANPYDNEGRAKLARHLYACGYHYAARLLISGRLVPLWGREYFPSRFHTFSVHDADAAERGIEVVPVEPKPGVEYGYIPSSVGLQPPHESMRSRPRWKRDHFVAAIEGGRCVASPWGYAVFDRNGHYSRDFCVNDGPMIAMSGNVPPSVKIPGTVLVLPHSWSHAVFHWVIETLPRFELARLAGFDPREVDHIATRGIMPWHGDYITALGIPHDKFGSYGNVWHIEADRLIVCSNVEDADFTIEPGYFEAEPWVSHMLRDLVPDPDPLQPPTERIYISRVNAGSRKCANEGELRHFLEHNGFQTVFFEDKSLAEKAAIMRRAAVVVSVAGAAMTNIPFMRPGAKAVVLYTRDAFTSVFNVLAANVGATHVHAVSPSMTRFYPLENNPIAEHLREIMVDLHELRDVLKQCCGIEASFF